MIRALKTAATGNLMIALLLVGVYVVYGHLSGLPIAALTAGGRKVLCSFDEHGKKHAEEICGKECGSIYCSVVAS